MLESDYVKVPGTKRTTRSISQPNQHSVNSNLTWFTPFNAYTTQFIDLFEYLEDEVS